MNIKIWEQEYSRALMVNKISHYNLDYQSSRNPGYLRTFPQNSKFTSEYVILHGIKIYGKFTNEIPQFPGIIIFCMKSGECIYGGLSFIIDRVKTKNYWAKLYLIGSIGKIPYIFKKWIFEEHWQ